MTFSEFFQLATRSESEPAGRLPYPYQERFADSDPIRHLVRAPTGAGKTATAVLGWLWRYLHSGRPTPRRLVYCLPMRVLVEQSVREARRWIDNLPPKDRADVHVLMGGVDADEWYLHPEKPAVLIGTQDMLLSRALNRGYAASRFHWPIDFGLLNNDCLWVFDEPQLMASGVSTSAQLAGLRLPQALGTFGPCESVWMSATLEPGWLDTIDFRSKFPGKPLELDEEDYDPKWPLHKRMTAKKTLARFGVSAPKGMKDVAKPVLENHIAGTQTLVVLNTVDRAKEVYAELGKLLKRPASPGVLLIHSRFRPREREVLNARLMQPAEDRIIVATQVVEAGVDISARTLITELAPWASIVQRIGRCNRTGDDGPGRVFWIDLDEKQALPYSQHDLDFARKHLMLLDDKSVSPKALDDYKKANEKPDEPFLPFEHKHVLRRRDLLDLFDTTPDLSGNDIDIQRFVRSDDPDTDVEVFWRDRTADGWKASPQRKELCNVPVGSIKGFLKKEKVEGFIWDHLEDRWGPISDPGRQIYPGLTILLPITAGGYDWNDDLKSGKGWDIDSKAPVTPLPLERRVEQEAVGSDPNSAIPVPLTIAEHTRHVCEELAGLLATLPEWLGGWREHLAKAGRGHDVGKALQVAQKAMYHPNAPEPSRLLAKSGHRGGLFYDRKHFRHELGSALAVLQRRPEWPFVVAYLIAAHHGRVRLAIRALPGEDPPVDPSIRFALGIRDGDTLPEVGFDDETFPAMALDLSPMQLGGDGSWTARALRLLADVGPFKLAYLEAILRAADVRASQKEARNA
jgi:CRISPR-associated endonuclease/helicase Cas3